MGNFEDRDGYISISRNKNRIRIGTSIAAKQLTLGQLTKLYEDFGLEEDDLNIVPDGEFVQIFKDTSADHTGEFITQTTRQIISALSKADIIKHPIVCRVKIPAH